MNKASVLLVLTIFFACRFSHLDVRCSVFSGEIVRKVGKVIDINCEIVFNGRVNSPQWLVIIYG